jgi:rhomboid protease GluP
MQKPNLSLPKINVLLVGSLLLINIGVWLVQIFKGVAWLDPKPDDLMAWGGNLAAYSLTTEPWRLLSNIFVHGGLLHLALNMYMLLSVGLLAGRRFGAVGLAVVYLLGGVLASIASAWWQMHSMFPAPSALSMSIFGSRAPSIQLIVSVGASGAIMAVCGALLAGMFRDFNAALAPSEEDEGLGKSLLQVVGINLALGFVVQGTDQSAHIGGLLAGLALGLALPMTGPALTLAHRVLRALVPALLVGALAWWLVQQLPTQELRDVHAQLMQDKIEAQDKVDKANQLKNADQQAADEKRNLPTAVFERELAMGQVIQVGKNATDMALSVDEKLAYVVDTVANQLSVVDLQSGQVVRVVSAKKIPLKPGYCNDDITAGHCYWLGAGSVAVAKDQSMAVVPSMVKDGVALVDLSAGKIIKTMVTGKLPGSVIVSPDDATAYVVNAGDGTL